MNDTEALPPLLREIAEFLDQLPRDAIASAGMSVKRASLYHRTRAALAAQAALPQAPTDADINELLHALAPLDEEYIGDRGIVRRWLAGFAATKDAK